MNRVYPNAKNHLWAGEIDLGTDDLRIVLVNDTAIFDDDHDVLGDLGAVTVGSPVSLGPVMVIAGAVGDAGPVTVTDAPAASQVAGFVAYIESGSPATRYLVAWIDTAPDSSPIDLLTTGDDVTVTLADPFIRL